MHGGLGILALKDGLFIFHAAKSKSSLRVNGSAWSASQTQQGQKQVGPLPRKRKPGGDSGARSLFTCVMNGLEKD